MFGLYRTILALAVAVQHLLSIGVIGHYAVHGFFILSGYLMTLILHQTYGYTPHGIKYFAINRFLRLYPSYWVILSLSLVAINLLGEANATGYREYIFVPRSIEEWAQNISLVYFDFFPGTILPRISPPTWALTIELFFYALIAIGFSRSKAVTTIWFLTSLVYMLLTHILELGYDYRYKAIFSGTLPFSIGAMMYHFAPKLNYWPDKINSDKSFIILIAIFVGNALIANLLRNSTEAPFVISLSFYANYLINATIILVLAKNNLSIITRSADKAIGDLSYPLYLMHWQVGFVTSMIIWDAPIRGWSLKGFVTFMATLIACTAICWLINKLVDNPIENLRVSFKKAKLTRPR